MGSYFRDYFSPKAHERATVGDTKMSFTTWDHLGWLNCDGRSVSKSQYYILWQVIGYTFGGSGDNFNLPDMRGRVAGAPGTGPGPTTYALGDSVGEQEHTLTIAEMPAHDHGGITGSTSLDLAQTSVVTNVTANTQQTTASAGVSSSYVTGINVTSVDPSITPNPHTHTITSQGGDDPHNNMQPTLFIGNTFIYCGIRSAGSYPYTLGKNLF